MSYDLYFYAHKDVLFSPEEAIKYFQGLRNIKITRAKFDTALINYENTHTGVNFRLFYNPVKKEDETSFSIPEVYIDTKISANINLFRPSTYALEAIPIITNFATKFNLLIFNPQDPKLKEGNTLVNYTEEQLIELWRKDNSFFIKGLGKKMARKYYLPKDKLLNLWNYQKEKETLNSCIDGEDIFIPTMYPFVNNKTGEVFTAVIWGDCINQVIPECDFIIIGRNTEWWERKLLKKPEKVFAINTYANVIDKMNPYLHPFQTLISGLMIFRSTHEKVARSIFNKFFKEEEYHKFEDVSMLSINNIYDEL